jgi:hypothetical protein
MDSKVSYNWLPGYIKSMLPVLEIFKMAGYIQDIPLIEIIIYKSLHNNTWHDILLLSVCVRVSCLTATLKDMSKCSILFIAVDFDCDAYILQITSLVSVTYIFT